MPSLSTAAAASLQEVQRLPPAARASARAPGCRPIIEYVKVVDVRTPVHRRGRRNAAASSQRSRSGSRRQAGVELQRPGPGRT